MEKLTVHLDAFEGPMDLLYHLIEKNKINIYDIPIVTVTEQYLAFLDLAGERDMESMSEFLLMAATLLEIKSKMLLPNLKKAEEDEEADPREELVKKLLEYKKFRNAARELEGRQEDAALVLYKTAGESLKTYFAREQEETLEALLEGITLKEIYQAFEEVMRRREQKTDRVRSGFKTVFRDIYTIEDKILYIEDLLVLHPKVRFSSIFREEAEKMEYVVTFLALLEMIKRKSISIKQDALFDEITIMNYERGEADEAVGVGGGH